MQSQMANFDKNMASLQTYTSKIMHTNDDGTATVVEKSKDSD